MAIYTHDAGGDRTSSEGFASKGADAGALG